MRPISYSQAKKCSDRTLSWLVLQALGPETVKKEVCILWGYFKDGKILEDYGTPEKLEYAELGKELFWKRQKIKVEIRRLLVFPHYAGDFFQPAMILIDKVRKTHSVKITGSDLGYAVEINSFFAFDTHLARAASYAFLASKGLLNLRK